MTDHDAIVSVGLLLAVATVALALNSRVRSHAVVKWLTFYGGTAALVLAGVIAARYVVGAW